MSHFIIFPFEFKDIDWIYKCLNVIILVADQHAILVKLNLLQVCWNIYDFTNFLHNQSEQRICSSLADSTLCLTHSSFSFYCLIFFLPLFSFLFVLLIPFNKYFASIFTKNVIRFCQVRPFCFDNFTKLKCAVRLIVTNVRRQLY